MGFILLIRLSEPIQGLSPKILGEQSFQVTLAERDHVIEQITPATAHPTLGDAVLPRAPARCSDRFQPNRVDGGADRIAELAVPVMNQVSVTLVIRKCLTQLLGDPDTGRVPSYVAV